VKHACYHLPIEYHASAKETPMNDETDIQQALAGHMLSVAKASGAMKALPRDLTVYFYTDTWDAAHDLYKELTEELQYAIRKPYQLRGPDAEWSVVGQLGAKVMLSEEFFEEWVERMNELAERFDARFDGWEFPLDVGEEEIRELVKGMKVVKVEDMGDQWIP
jgi:hypothetical protein